MKNRDQIIIGNVFKLADEKGWTNVLLAERIGTSPQHLNAMKKGRRGVGKHLLERFAKALNVNEGMLSIDKAEFEVRKYGPVFVFSPDEVTKIKNFVNGIIPGGNKEKGRMAITASHKVGKRAFGIKITDHAMAPRFLPGDIAVIDPDDKSNNEGIYAVKIGENILIRRIRRFSTPVNEIRIVADNGQEPDIIIKDVTSLEVLGRVVELFPNIS